MKKKLIAFMVLVVLGLMITNSVINRDTTNQSDLSYTKDNVIELFDENIEHFDNVVYFISSFDYPITIHKENEDTIIGKYSETGDIIYLDIDDVSVINSISYILDDMSYISIYGDSSYIEFHRHTYPGPQEENTTPSQKEVGILYNLNADEDYNYGLTRIINNWFYYEFGYV